MKNKIISLWLLVMIATPMAFAQTTAFTYQGRLNDGSNPATGLYDLRFAIFDAASAGTRQGNLVTNTATAVSNGLFIVTLDFGNQFPGAARWLEIAVRTNGAGAFATLNPRQALTPTPYAIYAPNAGTAGGFSGSLSGDVTGTQGATVIANVGSYAAAAVAAGASAANAATSANVPGLIVKRDGSGNFSASAISGSFIGDGSGLINLSMPAANLTGTINGSQIAPAAISTAHLNTGGAPTSGQFLGYNGSSLAWLNNAILGSWTLNGNNLSPGQFIGSTNNQPVEIRVNGSRVLRLDFNGNSSVNAPNIVGGSPNNFIAPGISGSVISGGGGSNAAFFVFSQSNSIAANQSTIAGGNGNSIEAGAYGSAIGGGLQNIIQSGAYESVIAGGFLNQIQTNSYHSVIGGGYGNAIYTNSSEATVLGGYLNAIESFSGGSTLSGYACNIRSNCGSATVSGGEFNSIAANSYLSTIGGGYANYVLPNSPYATIPGGSQNQATNLAFAAGSQAQAIHTGAFVWADSQNSAFASTAPNQFLIRAAGGVGINTTNPGAALGIQVASGQLLQFRLDNNFVPGININNSGGAAGILRLRNAMEIWASDDATRAGHLDVRNVVGAATIALDGSSGAVTATSFSGSGSGLTSVNAATLQGLDSTSFWKTTGNAGTTPGVNFIGTSDGARLLIKGSFVGIGRTAPISGADYFSVDAPVGPGNFGGVYVNTTNLTALPFYGYAQGGNVRAYHYVDGGDANKWKLNLGSLDRIVVTVGGNVGIGNTAPTNLLMVSNARCDGSTWINASDRNLKENFTLVNPAKVLDQVLTLPVTRWNYKSDAGSTHLGPVAQDFKAAFQLGSDDRSIATVDESGVALAAIQGLNQKLEDRSRKLEEENAELKARNESLEARLERLEKILSKHE